MFSFQGGKAAFAYYPKFFTEFPSYQIIPAFLNNGRSYHLVFDSIADISR